MMPTLLTFTANPANAFNTADYHCQYCKCCQCCQCCHVPPKLLMLLIKFWFSKNLTKAFFCQVILSVFPFPYRFFLKSASRFIGSSFQSLLQPLPVNFFQIEILKLVVDTNVSVPTMFLFLCVQFYSVLWCRGGTSPGSYLKARAQIQVQSKKRPRLKAHWTKFQKSSKVSRAF